MAHWTNKVMEILTAETSDLRQLARLAGAEPKCFYKGANFRNADLTTENLEGLALDNAILERCVLSEQQVNMLAKMGVLSARFYDISPEKRKAKLAKDLKFLNTIREHFSVDDCSLQYAAIYTKRDKDKFTGFSSIGVEPYLRCTMDGQHVHPNKLFDALNLTNQTTHVDAWVLAESCKTYSQILQKSSQKYPNSEKNLLNVNVSPESILDFKFLEQTIATLNKYNFDRSRLVFDIPDLMDLEKMKFIGDRLHAIGVRFAIDNFGIFGISDRDYSMISPDFIKIDRAFIHGSTYEDVNLESVVQKSKESDATVIGCGVEDSQTIERLVDLDITYFSGYYFGVPIGLAEFEENDGLIAELP